MLNVTPDSFSDGGEHDSLDNAIDHALRMVAEGADVIDVGGESTRPGAGRVDPNEQVRRVAPVIETLRRRIDDHVAITVDTTRSTVAQAGLDSGADAVNDVSAATDDQAMLPLVAGRGCPIILMHMRGEPRTMQDAPRYDDVVAEVRQHLLDRAEAAEAAGVARHRIVIDPGIGFGKTTDHNLALLANLDVLVETGYPVMLGASRKRFLGQITGESDPQRRDAATAATTAMGVAAGVRLVRVHDVAASRHAADVTFAALMHRKVS